MRLRWQKRSLGAAENRLEAGASGLPPDPSLTFTVASQRVMDRAMLSYMICIRGYPTLVSLATPIGGCRKRVFPRGDDRVLGAASDQRITAGLGLQRHLTRNGLVGLFAVRVEEGRAVIAFDGGDRPARFEDALQCDKRVHRSGQMLQYEAEKNMIERFRREVQSQNIALEQRDVGKSMGFDRFARLAQ